MSTVHPVVAEVTDRITRRSAATRAAYFKETGVVRCEVLDREGLAPGTDRPGPLIVESPDTTVVVPPGWRLRVEAGGLIALESAHA